jgi:curved DNA-binding protein CbpA
MISLRNSIALALFMTSISFCSQEQEQPVPQPYAGIPIPSEEEMRKAFNDLMNMSPEEREELEKQALKQLESIDPNALKKIEEEMVQRLEALTPEERAELERRGREMLVQWGIDPDTGRPLEKETQPTPERPKEEKQTTPVVAPVKSSKYNQEQIAELLVSLIRRLKEVRHIATEEFKDVSLGATHRDLDFLIRSLSIINQLPHHQRLLTKEYESLISLFDQLNTTLQSNELRISAKTILAGGSAYEADPYDVLNIPYTATNKEIEYAYQKLANKYNPEDIRERLLAHQATHRELEKAEKEARINLSLITDAYEALSNPPTRAQVDRERKARQKQQKSSAQEAKTGFLQSIDAIASAINKQQIIQKLTDFLQKYEPEQLAQLKTLQAAEEARKKEYEEASKKGAVRSPTIPSLPSGRPSDRSGRDYHDYDRYQPYRPGGDRETPRPSPSSEKPESNKDKGKGEDKDKEKDKEKEKEKPKESERKPTPPQQQQAQPQPTSQPRPAEQGTIDKLVHEIAAITVPLSEPILQQKLAAVKATSDLLQEDSLILQQAEVLQKYAEKINNLNSFAKLASKKELQEYKAAWQRLKNQDSYKQAKSFMQQLNAILQTEEPTRAGALVTERQAQLLRLLTFMKDTINTIESTTQKIDILVEQ